jgi:hypothetical protein
MDPQGELAVMYNLQNYISFQVSPFGRQTKMRNRIAYYQNGFTYTKESNPGL